MRIGSIVLSARRLSASLLSASLLCASLLCAALSAAGQSPTSANAPAGSQIPFSHWSIGPFTRPVDGPVIEPRPWSVFDHPISHKSVHWEALHTFNPGAVVRKGKVVVLYRAEDNSGTMEIGMHTSRLGMAESDDGIHFVRLPEPVFYPAEDGQKAREWPGGVEDPRIVETPDGAYVLMYTQWNRTTYTIGVATSPDLVHWTKQGPALGSTGPYAGLMYKSASVVTELRDGRLVAARIQGKFWMYWGEVQVRVATSPDLIHWTPVEEAPGKPLVVLAARPSHFDSGFPEVGPPALLTHHGIVLIYNGKNSDQGNGSPDGSLGPGAYSAGEALFDADAPAKLIGRAERPSLRPERAFERTGQYSQGTTFAEGLVLFKDTWFLYYGTADSFVGVATAPGTAGR